MKIDDLFEQQNEGIGSALGKVAGAVGKGVGGVVGGARALGSAAKAGYKAGSAGAQQSILGQTFPDIDLNPGNKAKGQQQGTAPAQGQQQTAPVQGNTTQANTQQSNPQQAQGTAPNSTQDKVEPTLDPAQGQQQQAPAGNQQQQQAPAKPAAMKGSEIAGELKGVWDKASADQGSMTGSPQVRQQIIAMAKSAGMTGMKIENRQFYSKFLGQNI